MSWWGAQPPRYRASAFWDPSQAAQLDQALLENAFIVLLTVTVTVQLIAYNFFWCLKANWNPFSLFDLEVDLLELLATNNHYDVALGWLALRSLVKTGHGHSALVDVNMHLMSQSAMISLLSNFHWSLTKGFGCQVMCAIQNPHQRPGWGAWKVNSYLRGGEPNLGLQLIATFHSHLPSVAYVMLVFVLRNFLLLSIVTVSGLLGEMCHDMEHIGAMNIWVGSTASVHKIWQFELKYSTPGLLGSSCNCKICSVCAASAIDSCFEHLTLDSSKELHSSDWGWCPQTWRTGAEECRLDFLNMGFH